MKKKTTILIAGIGGVGGYFGGLLAKRYENDPEIAIYFLSRGEHLTQIQNKGLQVIHGENKFVAIPAIATDNAIEIGVVDYIILCVKSYDLEKTLIQLKPCIKNDTILLPLLNGVNSAEKIKEHYPQNLVLNGCVYIVSKIKTAGIVENFGTSQTLFFGLESYHEYFRDEKMLMLHRIFINATINATFNKNITAIVWEKFHLVGANSTATTYFNCCVGELFLDSKKETFLYSLITEVNKISTALGIVYNTDIVNITLQKIKALPFETTSSMQRDYEKSAFKSELETITGYIVQMAKQLSIDTPNFNTAYLKLNN